jgi:predicted DCC family thiol-disulfide oxidoreductase YuxK
MATNVLVYDGSCGLCRRAAAVAVRITRGQVDLVDYNRPAEMQRVPGVGRAEAEASVVLVNHAGDKQHGYDAVTALICMARWRFPLCWVLHTRPVRWIGYPIYREVSRRRHRVSRWLGWG